MNIWRKIHDTQNLPDVSGQRFYRELFYNCQFQNVRGATFEQCCLLKSKMALRNLNDGLGLTLSLDCFTLQNVELSDAMLSSMLYLISLTTGNDEKREVLKRLVSPEIIKEHDKLMLEHRGLTMVECRDGLVRK